MEYAKCTDSCPKYQYDDCVDYCPSYTYLQEDGQTCGRSCETWKFRRAAAGDGHQHDVCVSPEEEEEMCNLMYSYRTVDGNQYEYC